ncbi:MAG: YiiD C-terminal domain-containing protein [Pseudomonadota bacterium]|mgnify:FL=1
MTRLAEAQAFMAELHRDIPLAAFMQLEAVAWDGHSLTLKAPLQPNINDKSTAFAGALASLVTVTGWAALMLWSREHLGACHVAVYESEIKYRYPVSKDFSATAVLPDPADMAATAVQIRSKGKARAHLQVAIVEEGRAAVTLTAGYAVWQVAET